MLKISISANLIGGMLLSMLASSVVNYRFEPLSGWVKRKTIKLVFVAFQLSTQHEGVRAKTG